jgi:hypothetical protein
MQDLTPTMQSTINIEREAFCSDWNDGIRTGSFAYLFLNIL